VAGRLRYLVGLVALLVARPCVAWESWGGDPGGSRLSPLREITSGNVGQPIRAFDFHTGDVTARPTEVMRRTKFEATPLFVEDSLIFCSPFNEVIARDPGSAERRCTFAVARPAPLVL
jgi:quinoprotein glucose dehydrogenase